MSIHERKMKAIDAKYVAKPPFPREIFIDLTSFCNHACVFCSNSKLKNKYTMKQQMVEKVLIEAYENGTRDIGMYATGESFIVKKLPEYIATAKKIGYEYIFITTNGALVESNVAKRVIDAGLDSIKFSISAGKRETYKMIHGKDDFDTVISNLKWISNYKKNNKLNCKIYVTMVYTNATKNEVDILKDIVLPYIDDWDPHTLTNQCGNKYDNNELGEIEEKNIRGRVKSNICFQPFKSFTVTPEGFISACVLDYQRYLIVGDFNTASLKDIWLGDEYIKFRKMHMENTIDELICYNCVHNTNKPIKALMPAYISEFNKNIRN